MKTILFSFFNGISIIYLHLYIVHECRFRNGRARTVLAAGPESLEDYFLLGRKVALNLWYVDTRPKIHKNCHQALFEGLSYLASKFKKVFMLSYIFYSHNSILLKNCISQICQTFKCSGTVFANLARYRRTKNLLSLFDPKIHLFENILLQILAQLSGT